MIDIETLGTRSTSRMLSIGVCIFHWDAWHSDTFKTFTWNINQASYAKKPYSELFTTDTATLKWWSEQEEDAAKAFLEDPVMLEDALEEFSDLAQSVLGQNSHIWANSPSFDLSIIDNHCTMLDVRRPWNYWAEGDYRTFKIAYVTVTGDRFQNGLP